MKIEFFIFVLFISAQVYTQTLSPQQYCESIEKKVKNSFEMLNIETGVPSMSPNSSEEVFVITAPNYFPQEFRVCDQTYSIFLELSDNARSIERMEFRYIKIGPNYPICNGVKLNGKKDFIEGLPSEFPEVQNGCYNMKGIKFGNGNTCTLDSIKYQPVLTETRAIAGIQVTASVTKVNVTSVTTVKYCSKGNFFVASLRAGPLSQKHDSVISCIKGSGASQISDFPNEKPIQGEIMLNIKKWLVENKGCS